MLFRACLVFLVITATSARAEEVIFWDSQKLRVGMGSILDSADTLRISANENGQVFISVGAQGIALHEFPTVRVEFVETPPGAQFFVAWRTSSGDGGQHPFFLSPTDAGTASVSMSPEAMWEGTADQIGLGIWTAPHGIVSIKSISLIKPTFSDKARELLREWSAFRDWVPADANAYTGTLVLEQGVPPVPFFTRALMLALFGYLAYLVVARKFRQLNWHVAGGIILAFWIALDALWQFRLGQQVVATYGKFSGKSSAEKLQVSIDAPTVNFIAKVKARIDGTNARVFIASANDYSAMLSAYYIAPVNTYWNRGGPELPESSYISSGNYILLLEPSVTHYLPANNTIVLPDDTRLPVRVLLQERIGMLLQVI